MVNTLLVRVCRVTSSLFLGFIAFQVSAASSASLSMAQAQSMEQQPEVQPAASAQQAPQRGIWVKLGKREADKELLVEGLGFVEKEYQGLLASIACENPEEFNLERFIVSIEDQSKIKDLRALPLVKQHALFILILNACVLKPASYDLDPASYTSDIGCSLQAYEYLFYESSKRWINSSGQIRRDKRDIVQRVQKSLVAAYIRHFYNNGQINVSKVWERLSDRKLKLNKQMMACGNEKMSLSLVLIDAIVVEACKHAIDLGEYQKELDEKMHKEVFSLKLSSSDKVWVPRTPTMELSPLEKRSCTPGTVYSRDNYIRRRAALMNTPNLQTNCARNLESELNAAFLSDTPAPVVEAPRKPENSSSTGSVGLVQEPSLDKPILAPGKMKTFFRKPVVRWALFVAAAALCTAGGFGGQEVYRRYKAAQLLTKAPTVVHVSLLSRLAAFLIRCKTVLVG